jgi:hypothetical protein
MRGILDTVLPVIRSLEGGSGVLWAGDKLLVQMKVGDGTFLIGCPIEVGVEKAPVDEGQIWGLRRIGPGVWKLSPSVMLNENIHTYVTIAGVAEPLAPWESAGEPSGR